MCLMFNDNDKLWKTKIIQTNLLCQIYMIKTFFISTIIGDRNWKLVSTVN